MLGRGRRSMVFDVGFGGFYFYFYFLSLLIVSRGYK